MNAGVALAQRTHGDRRSNLQQAVALFTQALEGFGPRANPEDVARTRTNLAQALVQIPGATTDTFEQAVALCELALEYRTPDRDVENWSYSMVNLGTALGRLAQDDPERRAEAQAVYAQVIDGPAGVSPEARSHAQLNAINLVVDEIRSLEEAQAEEVSDATSVDRVVAKWRSAKSLSLTVAANAHASRSVRGRARRRAGDAASALGDEPAARKEWATAFSLLEVLDPTAAREIATTLAHSYAEARDWPHATGWYRSALALLDALVSAAHTLGDRTLAAGDAARLSRWASQAFARNGDLVEAVIAIENGRTRELRRQLALESPQVADLRKIAPEALRTWQTATLNVIRDPPASHDSGHSRDRALSQIRAIPGFETFATGATLEGISAAAVPGHPVVFVNPAPNAADLLRVDHTGHVSLHSLGVTGQEIAFRVLFGVSPDDPAFSSDDTGESNDRKIWLYQMAAAADPSEAGDASDPDYLSSALDNLLPWVGAHIAGPIADLLLKNGDQGAVLVISGPLAGVPVAAAPFGANQCLIDDFTITATPSATAHAYALRRAHKCSDIFRRLVAVANPTLDLHGTESEVDAIQRHFATAEVAFGEIGSVEWLRAASADATVLHLACHGFGGLHDGADSGLLLASYEEISSSEIARLPLRGVRVAVASACQTNVIEVGDQADEAVSVGSALLEAGSACSIASLWPVDDLATSLLMVRLYEEMSEGSTPPEALRTAQRWLRSIDLRGEQAYVDRYPVLEGLRARPRPRGPRAVTQTPARNRPYGHPSFWAGFVALGA